MKTSVIGLPRIGCRRELKFAVEKFFAGQISEEELEQAGFHLRKENLQRLRSTGINYIPCNDFSFYDRMLDMSLMLGIIPERFQEFEEELTPHQFYFALARGITNNGRSVKAMKMLKWFNTNYHYVVPELNPCIQLSPDTTRLINSIHEAITLGIKPVPVLIGPITFIMMSELEDHLSFDDIFSRVSAAYQEIISRISLEEIAGIAFEEPALCMTESEQHRQKLSTFYNKISARCSKDIFIHTSFDHVGKNYQTMLGLPVKGLGLDLLYGPENLNLIKKFGFPADKLLFAGIVDGRNVWKADLFRIDGIISALRESVASDQLVLAPSCSLLHCPLSLTGEDSMPEKYRQYLSFAFEKLDELIDLGRIYRLNDNDRISRLKEERRRFIDDVGRIEPGVKEEAIKFELIHGGRKTPLKIRASKQRHNLTLPLFPTTTIGSFPQTPDIRQMRNELRMGKISREDYNLFIRGKISEVIALQEKIGLDVLVHGEYERNDMVEYFAEKLTGFVFTANGWVQSFGTRCVKPPIIFGDVNRPGSMTLEETLYAQSLTSKPVKGMLTGPVTMLNWSFVRDDIPREHVCAQLAVAIRNEVADLESNNIKIIQIDEPAFREGVPLRDERRMSYFRWAVNNFLVASGSAGDNVQIHTHMCYSDFNSIIDEIIKMDADVISLENSRAEPTVLEIFREHQYPGMIGPGVYDIHSPNIPSVEEITDRIMALQKLFPDEQLWINPDCGLKTRRSEEIIPALTNMVTAAKGIRNPV